MADVDNTPTPEHVEDAKTEVPSTDLADLTAETVDPIVEELTQTQKADDTKTVDTPKDDKVSQEKAGISAEAIEEIHKTIQGTGTTEAEKVAALQNQLKFYEQLFGPKEEAKAFVSPTGTPEQPNTAQANRPVPNILDAVQVSEEDLTNLLSGDPQRAAGTIRKFVGMAMYLTTQNFVHQQRMAERVETYNNSCVNAFYEKFDDLKEFRPIVKYAGDYVQQRYEQQGIQKYPHQIIDEIGNLARQIKIKMLGGSTSPTKPTPTIKQGEVGGTKPAPASRQKPTDEQNEMFDLLHDT